ncbi:MAG: hypothetical protein LBK94_05445 [Prevotellaceae bacterium]|jgi:hypothetical protein|nr:hypothetical protein [Prevotellaceae bacterium]
MINYIKKSLTKIHNNFQDIKFKCEFNQASSTYIIEVKPLDIFKKNEEYNEFEYEFTRKFELEYPGFMIMFVSDDSLIKVENPIFEIDYDLVFETEKNIMIWSICDIYIRNWISQDENNISFAA